MTHVVNPFSWWYDVYSPTSFRGSLVPLDFSWESRRLRVQTTLCIADTWCNNVMQAVLRRWISNIRFHDSNTKSASMQSKGVGWNQLQHLSAQLLIMKPFSCSGAGILESVALWLCRTCIQYLYSLLSSTWLIIHVLQKARTSQRRADVYTFSLSSMCLV